MRELLEDLRKLDETEELSLEDVYTIFENSLTFDDVPEGIKDLIEQGEEVTVGQSRLDGYPVTTISTEPFVNIMDYETFKDYMLDIAVEYKNQLINDWIEPYFDVDGYYKDCLEDIDLRNFILEQARDISKCEYSNLNGKDYVIIKE